jgi:hypothetical protein
MREPQGAVKPAKERGWVHILNREAQGPQRTPAFRVRASCSASLDWDPLVRSGVARTSEEAVAALAEQLGVSHESLRGLRAFQYAERRAWAFPMWNDVGDIVGVRLRAGGRKFAISGSRNGLFVPADLAPSGSILVTEGESDAAALLSLGFDAIGVPGVRQCSAMVAQFVRGRPVVIVGDNDDAGAAGVDDLLRHVLPWSPSVKIVRPPEGLKDARAWLRAGLSRQELAALIERTEPRRLRIMGA